MIEEKVGEMTQKEAIDFFVRAKVPVAPVYQVDEIVKDPHLIARDMFVDVEHPNAGKVKVPNFPVKLSETPGEIVSAAPLLGQHNREILMGVLGYTEEKVSELERAGIIATES
jgi:CoA:oxalate CoA-transferase